MFFPLIITFNVCFFLNVNISVATETCWKQCTEVLQTKDIEIHEKEKPQRPSGLSSK